MNKITQTARYRQSLILYAQKHGVTEAAKRYRTYRQYIYRWMKRYDGTLQSLEDRSHRPHSHPKQHQPEEIRLIDNMRRRNPNAGLVVFWVKLRQRGYSRSISGLYRFLRKRGQMAVKLPNPKYTPKPYKKADYPGQKVQIDVKYAFSSSEFIKHCVERFPYAIECVQTDNGPEFTNRLNSQCPDKKTLFEITLQRLCIQHKLIKPFTPRHNGKVERSHRKDNEYFYSDHKFFSFDDYQKQLAVWNRKYNDFPMRPLGWLSPKQTLFSFPNVVTRH